MTHKERALAEMAACCKPGGRLLVLEFSQVWQPLRRAYDWYSFKVLPRLGRLVAGDARAIAISPNRSASIPTRKRFDA